MGRAGTGIHLHVDSYEKMLVSSHLAIVHYPVENSNISVGWFLQYMSMASMDRRLQMAL